MASIYLKCNNMKNKKHLYSLIEFKLKKSNEIIRGILINYSEFWTIIINNPVDYVLDGIKIINNEEISKFKINSDKLASEIFRKKISSFKKLESIPINNSYELCKYLKMKKEIFSIENSNANVFLIGKISTLKENEMSFRILDSRGKWRREKRFSLNEIDIIEFNTDYINSLALVAK